jgi:hypothetical protein
MNHPNIAKVLDGGTTDRRPPVLRDGVRRGASDHAYCDKHSSRTAQRLELFQQVCDGVQHAHQKGVIHRDLKPGNILVARDGEADREDHRLRLARATDQRLPGIRSSPRTGQPASARPSTCRPSRRHWTGSISTRAPMCIRSVSCSTSSDRRAAVPEQRAAFGGVSPRSSGSSARSSRRSRARGSLRHRRSAADAMRLRRGGAPLPAPGPPVPGTHRARTTRPRVATRPSPISCATCAANSTGS